MNQKMTRGSEAGSGAGDWRISENPDGSRHIFLVTGDETGGEYLRLRVELPPHASGPPMHYHVGYTEKFDVLEGKLDVYVGKKNHLALVSGQSASVPLEVPHKFWNATDELTVFEAEIRPADDFEKTLRVADGLARDGKTSKRGVPKNPLELGLIYQLAQSYQPGMPRPMQNAIAGTLARIARWRGYDPDFPQYTRPQQ